MTGRPVVALLDYGVGNLHSLAKALEGEGARVRVADGVDDLDGADALVLPGVGAWSAAVEALAPDPAPVTAALDAGLPCLGICLGMQLLFEGSEEGPGQGLGRIPGRVRRLRAEVVPQMGWNDVEPVGGDADPDPLFRGLPDLVAYYANSFVCEPDDPAAITAWTEYGETRFAAGVRRGRTWGVQFHPEKSSAAGRHLLANFLAAVDAIRAGASDGGGP